jgi:hypothetical protein
MYQTGAPKCIVHSAGVSTDLSGLCKTLKLIKNIGGINASQERLYTTYWCTSYRYSFPIYDGEYLLSFKPRNGLNC